jgi:hypothetical protein
LEQKGAFIALFLRRRDLITALINLGTAIAFLASFAISILDFSQKDKLALICSQFWHFIADLFLSHMGLTFCRRKLRGKSINIARAKMPHGKLHQMRGAPWRL